MTGTQGDIINCHIRRGVRIGQRNAYLFLPYFFHESPKLSPPIRTQATIRYLPRDSDYKPHQHHYNIILTPQTDTQKW